MTSDDWILILKIVLTVVSLVAGGCGATYVIKSIHKNKRSNANSHLVAGDDAIQVVSAGDAKIVVER